MTTVNLTNAEKLQVSQAERLVNQSQNDLAEWDRVTNYLAAISANLPTGAVHQQLLSAQKLKETKEVEYMASVAVFSRVVTTIYNKNNVEAPTLVQEYLANCRTIGIEV